MIIMLIQTKLLILEQKNEVMEGRNETKYYSLDFVKFDLSNQCIHIIWLYSYYIHTSYMWMHKYVQTFNTFLFLNNVIKLFLIIIIIVFLYWTMWHDINILLSWVHLSILFSVGFFFFLLDFLHSYF